MCIEKVPVGYEAVVYSVNGGVQDETLTQGWHIIAPTKKAKIFTISNEQYNSFTIHSPEFLICINKFCFIKLIINMPGNVH